MRAEYAWPDGPYRKVGSGNGKSSRYVCNKCLRQAKGIYFVECRSRRADIWLCADCKERQRPKQKQPKALREYEQGRRSPKGFANTCRD